MRYAITIFLLLIAALRLWNVYGYSWDHWAPATCKPDSCFCEGVGTGRVAQPSNAWSSMAFVLVGLLIAHASAPRQNCWNRMARDPAYRRLYGYALVAIGLGSYFYHASLTFAGQVCDMSGMYLLITFALLYGVARRTKIRSVAVISAYLLLNVILLGFQIEFPDLRRYMFGLLVLVLIGMESRYRREPGVAVESQWLWRGAAIMALAFFIWVLDITEVACDPTNPLQGHAVWHMLSAVAGWSLYRYYRSECTIPNE